MRPLQDVRYPQKFGENSWAARAIRNSFHVLQGIKQQVERLLINLGGPVTRTHLSMSSSGIEILTCDSAGQRLF